MLSCVFLPSLCVLVDTRIDVSFRGIPLPEDRTEDYGKGRLRPWRGGREHDCRSNRGELFLSFLGFDVVRLVWVGGRRLVFWLYFGWVNVHVYNTTLVVQYSVCMNI